MVIRTTRFTWLNDAVEHGYRDVEQIAADEDLKSLRGDLRFKQLLDRVRAASVPTVKP